MHGLWLSCLWYSSTYSVILENHLSSMCDWELPLNAVVSIHSAGAKISSEALKCFISNIDRHINFSCILSWKTWHKVKFSVFHVAA